MLTIEKLFFLSALLAALGSGLIAGVFFVFSTTIMRALNRVPNGAGAMRSINVEIINQMFLGVFLGTAVFCALIGILSIIHWSSPASAWLLAGALSYIVGSLAVTMIFNVPMNNALAAASENSNEVWKNYLANWTFWNHVRTLASLVATTCLIFGLTYL